MKGNQSTLMRAFYEAGAVSRWHTMPQVGGPLQVGQHSWGVAVLILTFCDRGPTLCLLRAALLHDAHERWSGDSPSPARRAIPALQEGENEAQARFWEWAMETHPEACLEDWELAWLRLMDCVEAWLWTQSQMALGNLNVANASQTLREAARTMVLETFRDHFVDPEGLWEALEQINLRERLPEALTALEEKY